MKFFCIIKNALIIFSGDIFHDAIAHRQILQLIVHCPMFKAGCQVTVRLADVEQHFEICPVRLSKTRGQMR